MLNRFSRRCPKWATALLLLASVLACSGDAGDGCETLHEDEVTELLQSARGNASRSRNGTVRPLALYDLELRHGDDLHVTANDSLQAVLMEMSRRAFGRDDSDSGIILLSVVILLGLIFIILTVWFAHACTTSGLSKLPQDIAFVQPPQAIREEAVPAICTKFLASTRDHPFTVRLIPLREDGDDWTLDVLSHWSHQAIMQISFSRGARKLEGALALRRSWVQVRTFNNGKYKDSLLGSINSMLEIFLPTGQKYGQLLPSDGTHVLQEESGREPRYSLGLENQSTISAVWLPRVGMSPENRDADQLQDGLMKMGGQPPRHSRRGSVLGTVARPEGSNGDRIELMNVPGTDAVLLLLSAFGLVVFNGALDLVNPEQFKQEKTGLGWVSAPPPETESPTARSSLAAAGSAFYDRARDSLSTVRTVYT